MTKPYYELLAYADPHQREKWRAIYNFFNEIDIFYYPEYCRLFELHGDGEPFLFVYYQSPQEIVIYPFLKRSLRQISWVKELDKDLFDITSPYGYSGYLRNSETVNMEKFYEYFKNYCFESNIISEFIRFHPILENVKYAPKDISSIQYNKTICIDLSKKEEDIFNNMNQKCRNKVRKAKKNGVKIILDENFCKINIFHSMYTETMKRLTAHDYYYFKSEWFNESIKLLKEKIFLVHAIYKDTIITSSIFMVQWPIISYFLIGSLFNMRHLAATNLLLFEIALWAKKRGLRYFHLGGGYSPNDSLFSFKASFSPSRQNFYIGGVIHHQEYYDYLCYLRFHGKSLRPDIPFFPLYRVPE